MSKMEIFLTIGDGCKLLTLSTKGFILGIARILDVPVLVLSYKAFGNKPWLGKGLEKVPEDSFLVTTNVVGLYPSITHKGDFSIKKQIRGTNLKIPTNDLVKLAEFLLKNIFFELDNKIKQQICGTATGTNFAPPYVCIYMNKTDIFLKRRSVNQFRYTGNIFLSQRLEKQEWKCSMNFCGASNLHTSHRKTELYFRS